MLVLRTVILATVATRAQAKRLGVTVATRLARETAITSEEATAAPSPSTSLSLWASLRASGPEKDSGRCESPFAHRKFVFYPISHGSLPRFSV